MTAGDDPWTELDQVADNLARVSVRAVRAMASMPDSADLAARMVQVVGLMGSLLIDGRRALAERDADELRELVLIKSDFLRLSVHELRRPLGLLNGYVSLIRDGTYGDLPERMQPGLQMVEAGAAEMQRLVDGLASIARLEDRADALRREPTRLGKLVTESVAAIEIEAASRRISIQRHLPEPDVLAIVDGDQLRIAVINLLSNAIRHSPDGAIVTVVVSHEGRPAISVSDQGPGIDPDHAERVFEAWHRAPGALSQGLGLGLYIVRQIVAFHGGEVALDSTPGIGSTFSIVLPG